MHQDFLPAGIVVLTGAGISKESGIDTFRDKDGLWTRVNLEEVATIEAWHRDKKKVLDFYNDTRKMFRAAHIVPNAAHKALAQLEQKYEGEVTVVTQNIDPLHEQAGSKHVIHMHGRDGEIRCMNCGTVTESDDDLTPAVGLPALQGGGRTPAQHRLVRRDADAHGRDRRGAGALRPVPGDRHVGRGLSGGGLRAAGPPPQPRAHTVELNLEPTDNQPLFHEHIYGPATLTVPPYVERVLANGWK